jgi:hypothetical protein
VKRKIDAQRVDHSDVTPAPLLAIGRQLCGFQALSPSAAGQPRPRGRRGRFTTATRHAYRIRESSMSLALFGEDIARSVRALRAIPVRRPIGTDILTCDNDLPRSCRLPFARKCLSLLFYPRSSNTFIFSIAHLFLFYF